MNAYENNAAMDRRVRKTRRTLRQAFTTLLMKNDLKDISVIELTSLADLNRSTFYLHYKDIYDLYEQLKKEIADEFQEIISSHLASENGNTLFSVIAEAFAFIAENYDICMCILKSGDSEFLEQLIDMAKPVSVTDHLKTDASTKNYVYSFITSGCVGLLRSWFENGMKEKPEQMARLAENMVSNCITGY